MIEDANSYFKNTESRRQAGANHLTTVTNKTIVEDGLRIMSSATKNKAKSSL